MFSNRGEVPPAHGQKYCNTPSASTPENLLRAARPVAIAANRLKPWLSP